MDSSRLTGIRTRGFHGVQPQERRDGQVFVADVTLHLQLDEAEPTGDLGATVHYGQRSSTRSGESGVRGGRTAAWTSTC